MINLKKCLTCINLHITQPSASCEDATPRAFCGMSEEKIDIDSKKGYPAECEWQSGALLHDKESLK